MTERNGWKARSGFKNDGALNSFGCIEWPSHVSVWFIFRPGSCIITYRFRRRFIINVPESAKQNLIRICFQIELAHWFYLDFYVNNETKLRSCTIKEFAAHVFQVSSLSNLFLFSLRHIKMSIWFFHKRTLPSFNVSLTSRVANHLDISGQLRPKQIASTLCHDCTVFPYHTTLCNVSSWKIKQ